MKDHLSISQIDKWLRCPKQYEFHYEKGVRSATGSMITGNAYHDTLAYIFFRKMRDPKFVPSLQLISDQFDKEFEKRIKNNQQWGIDINWRDEKPGVLKDQGIKLANLYCRVKLPYVKPEAVEQKITTKIAEIPFVVIADVVEPGAIRDHKFTTKAYSDTRIRNDLQATAYTIVWKRPFCWDLALNQTQPFIQTVWAHRSQADFDFFSQLVTAVYQSIRTGIFPPNPTGWICSEQYCGCWSQCRGHSCETNQGIVETIPEIIETPVDFWKSMLDDFVLPYDF